MKKLVLLFAVLFCLAGGVAIAQATYCTPTENGGRSCYSADDAYKAGYRFGYSYTHGLRGSKFSSKDLDKMCPSEYSYFKTDWISGVKAGEIDRDAKRAPRY